MTRPTEVDPFEAWQADVAVVVRKVRAQAPRIDDAILDGRPATTFIAASTLQAMGDQVREDRWARRVAQAAGLATGTGTASRAPGNFAGIAIAAEYSFTLRHQIRTVHRHHHVRDQLCPLTVLPLDEHRVAHQAQARAAGDNPSNAALADYLYELVWTTDHTGLLRALQADVTWLEQLGRTYLEGEDRNTLAAPCPHCGRTTLVVYKETGVIRCERPRDPDGTRPACHCLRSDCTCRTDPAYVHQWFRETRPDAPDSWHALMRVLDHTATKETS